jgi:hypothetical protein
MALISVQRPDNATSWHARVDLDLLRNNFLLSSTMWSQFAIQLKIGRNMETAWPVCGLL